MNLLSRHWLVRINHPMNKNLQRSDDKSVGEVIHAISIHFLFYKSARYFPINPSEGRRILCFPLKDS